MVWTRRKLLRTAALAGAAAFCPRLLAKERHHADVLVVGAGLSGLAAASELSKAGLKTVVLEASAAVGGRTKLKRLGEVASVDCGAMWIHGWRGNPLSGLARAAGAELRPFDWNDGATFDRSARCLDYAQIAEGDRLLRGALDFSRRWSGELSSDKPLSEGLDVFARREKLGSAERSVLAAEAYSSITLDYAAPPAALSAWWWDEGKEFGGGDCLVQGGLGALAAGLAEDLEVRTKSVVELIDSSGSSPRLRLRGGVELAAASVLVTLPLGVLKSGSVRFVPDLPEMKKSAIKGLGFGSYQKTFLLFEEGTAFPPGQVIRHRTDEEPWSEWCDLSDFLGSPVLMALNAGPAAREVEAMSEDAMARSAMNALCRFTGMNFPPPRAVLGTRWGSEPFTKGAYSYTAVGSGPDQRRHLGEPLPGQVYFAGEATSVDYPSTAHGALLSGRAAAHRIMQDLGG
jgi:polyamine oxidase